MRLIDEPIDVHDGHGQQGSFQAHQLWNVQDPPDDLHAVNLVPMDRRAHKEPGTALAAVDDPHRNRQRGMGIETRDR